MPRLKRTPRHAANDPVQMFNEYGVLDAEESMDSDSELGIS